VDSSTFSAALDMNSIETSKRGTLKTIRKGHQCSILLVAFNRPHVKNAISDNVYLDLIDVLHDSSKDSSISCLVLTGTGSYFSSGADLTNGNLSPESGGRHSLYKPVGIFMMQLLAYPKIMAAAVNGPSIGIGTTMLFHFDLVYCTQNATFWTPFSRIAFVPELCSSDTFPARMGLVKANELLLLGKKIDAQTAVDWNICSRIVSDADVGSGDPFHPNSLASLMALEIDQSLLTLSGAARTAELYVGMVRGANRLRLQSVCQNELTKLDERFDNGEVADAAARLALTLHNGKKLISKL
jgi:peroxisomal 3,2-trans-enoyl-CoA isomerase